MPNTRGRKATSGSFLELKGLRMITHGNRILVPSERRYASLSRLRDLNVWRRPKTRPCHWLVVSIYFLSIVPSWAGAMLVLTLMSSSEASFLTTPHTHLK